MAVLFCMGKEESVYFIDYIARKVGFISHENEYIDQLFGYIVHHSKISNTYLLVR